MTLAGSNREGHVDTTKNVVGVGLGVEQSLTLEISLRRNNVEKIATYGFKKVKSTMCFTAYFCYVFGLLKNGKQTSLF